MIKNRSIQAKVLRVIQEREVERVGSHTPRKVDIRIIAATNRNLELAVEQEKFRKDLYYRLNVLVIPLPPLRERKQDIPSLCDHFLAYFCKQNNMERKRIHPDVLKLLIAHDWPGNVRELENTIERAVVMCDTEMVTMTHLPPNLEEASAAAPSLSPDQPDGGLDAKVAAFEKGLIVAALEQHGWRQNKAAAALGVSERSMWYKIKKLGIHIEKA